MGKDLDVLVEILSQQDTPVLLRGEPGVGKEEVARRIHEEGPRRTHTFLRISGVRPGGSDLEQWLWGAPLEDPEALEAQEGGTLYIHQIGAFPKTVQRRLAKWLRTGLLPLETPEGERLFPLDLRCIASSEEDLTRALHRGQIREDLYYQIQSVVLYLPPLRERQEEIPLLVEHCLRQWIQKGELQDWITPEALQILQEYPWPGNLQELREILGQAWLRAAQGPIGVAQVPGAIRWRRRQVEVGVTELALEKALERWFLERSARKTQEGGLLRSLLREVEENLIEMALVQTRGDQIQAAQLLGIPRSTLRKRIRELGLGERIPHRPASHRRRGLKGVPAEWSAEPPVPDGPVGHG